MGDAPDSELVRAAIAGDVDGFNALVQRHYGLVFGVAFAQLGDREAAEDLAQETFLRVHVRLADLRDGSKFAPWIARVARNLAASWLRTNNRRSRLVPLVSNPEGAAAKVPDPAPAPDQAAQRSESSKLVDDALAGLSPEERELVVLHYLHGWTQRELAERLDVNASTVNRRLDAALKRMRGAIEGTLRREVRRSVPIAAGAARAGALVAAFGALPAASRASVLASTAMREGATALASAAGDVASLASSSAVPSATATILKGVAIMGAKKIAAGIAIAVVAGFFVYAQVVPQPASFVGAQVPLPPDPSTLATGKSVAKWSDSTTDMIRGSFASNRIEVAGGSLAECVSKAWNIPPRGVQVDVRSSKDSRKDFVVEGGDAPQAFRNAIEEAWHVTMREESRRTGGLVVRAPKGPMGDLRPTAGGQPGMTGGTGKSTVTNQPIRTFLSALERETGKPIVDETGLSGKYDYAWSGRAADAAAGFGLTLVEEEREVAFVVVEDK